MLTQDVLTVEDGKQAAKVGNLQHARLIYETILQEDPRSEAAWEGLAEIVTETADQRTCYENVLTINPNNRAARNALRNLEPEADPFRHAIFQDDDWTPDQEPVLLPDIRDEDEAPTSLLVATGLALSLAVFTLGGSMMFMIVTSLVTP